MPLPFSFRRQRRPSAAPRAWRCVRLSPERLSDRLAPATGSRRPGGGQPGVAQGGGGAGLAVPPLLAARARRRRATSSAASGARRVSALPMKPRVGVRIQSQGR